MQENDESESEDEKLGTVERLEKIKQKMAKQEDECKFDMESTGESDQESTPQVEDKGKSQHTSVLASYFTRLEKKNSNSMGDRSRIENY